MDTLGKRLKKLRSQKKITQQQLADIFGVDRSTVASWEIDRREPDNYTIQKLADFFDTTTDYLLGRTDNPNPYHKEKQPDFAPAFKEKNLGDAIARIVNICAEFKLSKDIMLEMIDKAISVYGMPGGEGGIAAHGPNYPGSGALNRNGDDTPR